MQPGRVTLLGGSGFVGRALCAELARRGWEITVLTRDPRHGRELRTLPRLALVRVDPWDSAALATVIRGSDAVVNLVGILNERGDDGRGFQHVHRDLTASVLEACKRAGIHRYLHMSALNASRTGPSHYLRSKGEAEVLVEASGLEATIFRPSVIFGHGDGLFCRFEQLLRFSPLLPLACASARFQPVFIGDVAAAFALALETRSTIGRRYDLGGPDIMTLREIVQALLAARGWRRLVLPLGPVASRIMAEVMEHLPGKPFSRDNYRSASVDSVVPAGSAGLAALGIATTSVASVLPALMGGMHEAARHDWRRRHAGR